MVTRPGKGKPLGNSIGQVHSKDLLVISKEVLKIFIRRTKFLRTLVFRRTKLLREPIPVAYLPLSRDGCSTCRSDDCSFGTRFQQSHIEETPEVAQSILCESQTLCYLIE